jgi:methanogenic corrinoid protein MtbC1
MGRDIPKSSVVGIIPQEIDVEIALSDLMYKKFDVYIKTIIDILKKRGIDVKKNPSTITLSKIIERFKNPTQ